MRSLTHHPWLLTMMLGAEQVGTLGNLLQNTFITSVFTISFYFFLAKTKQALPPFPISYQTFSSIQLLLQQNEHTELACSLHNHCLLPCPSVANSPSARSEEASAGASLAGTGGMGRVGRLRPHIQQRHQGNSTVDTWLAACRMDLKRLSFYTI